MSSSIRTLLSDRRHPFLLALFLLSLLILLLLLFSDASSYLPFPRDVLPSSSSASARFLPSPPISLPSPYPNPSSDAGESGGEPLQEAAADGDDDGGSEGVEVRWDICRGGKTFQAVDYIPCLDNWKAIKKLKSRRHMEHRERHCPKPSPRCVVPLPRGYKVPVPWPKSRDMIWYDNVPHTKLIEYKKDQNWVRKSADYLVFPGGGTQFKEGVSSYIEFIEQVY
ncbi:hypothetical protein B296_00013565 [Ensete ventricosum]|uniref:Methyltransferase n=1 Tax=Ensete ventricosum TaxID=4639 RepID=A0A426ZMH4_ENSVE|nr:hypothetical protein B296_00013565 [Ensete ventricosum]